MASDKVTRKLHVLIVIWLACFKISTKVPRMKFCSSATLMQLRLQRYLSDLLYRNEINYALFWIDLRWFDLIRQWVSADTWHDVVIATLPKGLHTNRSKTEEKAPRNKIGFEGNITCSFIRLTSDQGFWNSLDFSFFFLNSQFIFLIILVFLLFRYL